MNGTHAHPGPKVYITVAVVLAIVTMIELALTIVPALYLGPLQNPVLIALTMVKAGLVALFFMHLKFDLPLYAAMFAGIIFICAVPFGLAMLILM